MAIPQIHGVLKHLQKVLAPRAQKAASDSELLERFFVSHDEAAFELLVWRHHRMVLGVCSRILTDANDVEDAFQASFLVLARKARTIRKRGSVSSWLYGVARRVALDARARNSRRGQGVPRTVRPCACEPAEELVLRELQAVFDEELGLLPEKYRAPVVLCYLEGKTYGEAGKQLGLSIGTVSTRLTRARQILKKRLEGRGLALSAGGLAGWLCATAASAGAPGSLVLGTLGAARALAAGQTATAAAISPRVATLMEGVMKTMVVSKIKVAAVLLLIVAAFGVGIGTFSVAAYGGGQSEVDGNEALAGATPNQQVAADKKPRDKEDRPKQKSVIISSEVAGRIVELSVKQGDKVRAGDVLVRLDDRQTKLDLDLKRARLQAALAEIQASYGILQEATVRAEAAKKLLDRAAISKEEYSTTILIRERYQLELAAKKAAAKIAEIEVENAQLVLSSHSIVSPADGTIHAVLKAKGELIKERQPLLEIKVGQAQDPPRKVDSPAPDEALGPQAGWADKLFLAMGATSHDFGVVSDGKSVTHRFSLKNIYSVPLEIKEIQVPASLVKVTQRTERTLQPGETGAIDITLDTGRIRGRKALTILVRIGGERHTSTATLQVSADAREGKGTEEAISAGGDVAWDKLGVKLEPVERSAIPARQRDVHGGMRVLAIRPSSPAAAAALQKGDILVGLHTWSTEARDAVPFALGYAQGAAMQSLRFVVLRDNLIVKGQFRLAASVAN